MSLSAGDGVHGRPLSIITSSDAGEADDSQASIGSLIIQTAVATEHESLDVLRTQVQDLFDRFAPADDDEEEAQDEDGGRCVMTKSLPQMLTEYEHETGISFMNEDGKAQLRILCDQFPDHRFSCSDLVKMIGGLQSAQHSVDDHIDDDNDAASSEGHAHSSEEDGGEGSGSDTRSESPDILKTDRNHQPTATETTAPRTSTPPKTPSRPAGMPHSQSLQTGLTHSARPSLTNNRSDNQVMSTHGRLRTLSSSGTPVTEEEKARARRKGRGGQNDSEAVLRGKGRAPPSAWQRPRPQALAIRGRKSSDASQSSLDLDASGGTSDAHFRRLRHTSQPVEPKYADDLDAVPRSVSTSYVFPRATSPAEGDETWYAEQQVQWEQQSARSRARSGGSSRAVSPELIEGNNSFQTFAALANNPSAPQSPSVGPAYHTFDAGLDASNEEFAALQRRYENVSRVLQEKERAFENTQSAHESTIADLESRVENLQDKLHASTRSGDEMKQKGQRYLDEISRLEGDLALMQKRGDALERVKEVMQQDLNHRETTLTALQGKVNDLQDRILTAERDASEHVENEQEWEKAREEYRQQIERLRGDVSDGMESQARVEELELERDALKAQLRDLHNELEEARRGSGFVSTGRNTNTLPTSTSKRLGSELARAFESNPEDSEAASGHTQEGQKDDKDGSDDDDDDAESGAADESVEDIVVTTTRRRRPKGSLTARTFTDTSTQTEAQVKAGPSAVALENEARPPPSYNEAASEKAILARAHPAVVAATERQEVVESSEGVEAGTSSAAEDYEDLTRLVGVRCSIIEESLSKEETTRKPYRKRGHRRREEDAVSSSPDGLTLLTSRLLGRLPSPAQDRLKEASASLSPQQRILALSGGILFLGIFVGSLLSSGSSSGIHHHYHDLSSAVMIEDSLAWHISNSLNLGLGSSGVEYATVEGVAGATWDVVGRMLLGSARQVAGVPI